MGNSEELLNNSTLTLFNMFAFLRGDELIFILNMRADTKNQNAMF